MATLLPSKTTGRRFSLSSGCWKEQEVLKESREEVEEKGEGEENREPEEPAADAGSMSIWGPSLTSSPRISLMSAWGPSFPSTCRTRSSE